MRLDQYLVESGTAPSKTKAQELIKTNALSVFINQKKLENLKPATEVEPEQDIEVTIDDPQLLKYVSRAGIKLEGALKNIDFNVNHLTVLDIGQSTGGFTDCLLRLGAKQVIGVDVGHEQLHVSLRAHPKVKSFQGINAKQFFDSAELMSYEKSFDLVVMDVSFVSLTKMLSTIQRALKPGGKFLLLVKPQFELTKSHLDKRGLVKDSESYDEVKRKVIFEIKNHQLTAVDYFKSPIAGADGNIEFFVFGQSNS